MPMHAPFHRPRIALLLAALLAAGCATLQTGAGQLSTLSGKQRVTLAWQSTDGMTGTMRVALPDGATYSGPFFQITSVERRELLAPAWWYGWYGGGPWPATEYVIRYSGKALANLQAAGGAQLRCTFHLAKPELGIAGGGEGTCRSTSGEAYRAFLPPS